MRATIRTRPGYRVVRPLAPRPAQTAPATPRPVILNLPAQRGPAQRDPAQWAARLWTALRELLLGAPLDVLYARQQWARQLEREGHSGPYAALNSAGQIIALNRTGRRP